MTRELSRRGALGLAISAAAGVAVGCGGNGSGGSHQLNVFLAQHSWSDALSAFVPEFEEETGLRVNLTLLGESQLSQQYSVKFNAGARDVDVMMVQEQIDGRLFRQNGWLVPISEQVRSDAEWDWQDFTDVTRGAVTEYGEVFGVPLVSERPVLYYRKDLLDEAGLSAPATFDELEKAAAVLTDASNQQYGFVARGSGAAAVPTASSYVYGSGSGWDEDGRSRLVDPSTIEGITFFGSLLNRFGPLGTLNMDWPEAISVFQQGMVAMSTEVDALYANFIDPEASRVTEHVGYAPFPAGPGGHRVSNIVPWSLGIAQSSPNHEAAWEFVRWATSPQMSKRMLANSNPVTRQSSWDDPEAVSSYPPDLARIIADPQGIDYVDHTSPRVVNAGKARDIIGTVVATAIDDGDVASAAQDAHRELQELMDSESR